MNHNQRFNADDRAPASSRQTSLYDPSDRLLGDLTAMRNAALMTEDEFRRMKGQVMATAHARTFPSIADTRCVLCNRVGFTHRERTVTAAQAFVEYTCGACEGSWRVFDAEPLIERRMATADRRRASRGDRRQSPRFRPSPTCTNDE
jgi:hypothetical protein